MVTLLFVLWVAFCLYFALQVWKDLRRKSEQKRDRDIGWVLIFYHAGLFLLSLSLLISFFFFEDKETLVFVSLLFLIIAVWLAVMLLWIGICLSPLALFITLWLCLRQEMRIKIKQSVRSFLSPRMTKPIKVGLYLLAVIWIGSCSYGLKNWSYWNYSWYQAAITPTVYFLKGIYISLRPSNEEKLADAVLANLKTLEEQEENGEYFEIGGAKIAREVGGFFVERDGRIEFVETVSVRKAGIETKFNKWLRDIHSRLFERDLLQVLEIHPGDTLVSGLYSPDRRDTVRILAWENVIASYLNHFNAEDWGSFDTVPKFPFIPMVRGSLGSEWFGRTKFEVVRFFSPHELKLETTSSYKEIYQEEKDKLTKANDPTEDLNFSVPPGALEEHLRQKTLQTMAERHGFEYNPPPSS